MQSLKKFNTQDFWSNPVLQEMDQGELSEIWKLDVIK